MTGSVTRGGSHVAGRRLGLLLLLGMTALALTPARAQAVSETEKVARVATVALIDGDRWYLLRPCEGGLEMLKEAYPELAALQVPESRREEQPKK